MNMGLTIVACRLSHDGQAKKTAVAQSVRLVSQQSQSGARVPGKPKKAAGL